MLIESKGVLFDNPALRNHTQRNQSRQMSDTEIYREHGIQFDIPQGWDVDEQTSDDGDTTITLSDGAAFWSLTLLWDRPAVEHVLSEAASAFAEEYEDLEQDEVQKSICGREAFGLNIRFVCMELINNVYLRCFRTGRFTGFVMYQMTDHEQKYYLPFFEEILESLDADQDGDVEIQ